MQWFRSVGCFNNEIRNEMKLLILGKSNLEANIG